jgi:hypothetical protein
VSDPELVGEEGASGRFAAPGTVIVSDPDALGEDAARATRVGAVRARAPLADDEEAASGSLVGAVRASEPDAEAEAAASGIEVRAVSAREPVALGELAASASCAGVPCVGAVSASVPELVRAPEASARLTGAEPPTATVLRIERSVMGA